MSNSELDATRLPRHIAIIPDGNGRWAKLRSLSRIEGHVKGTANVKDVVTHAKDLGIKVVTIYAFSEENWQRPEDEVNGLMRLLQQYLLQERQTLLDNNIQLRTIGNIKRLPDFVLTELLKTIDATKHCNEMVLNFAISYGSQQEIINAVQKMAQLCLDGKLKPEEIDQKMFSNALETAGLADPDLFIRTSGEMRISNYLLWQMAYTELYITETLWPDFDKQALEAAILSYQNRERRFGFTGDQIKEMRSQQQRHVH